MSKDQDAKAENNYPVWKRLTLTEIGQLNERTLDAKFVPFAVANGLSLGKRMGQAFELREELEVAHPPDFIGLTSTEDNVGSWGEQSESSKCKPSIRGGGRVALVMAWKSGDGVVYLQDQREIEAAAVAPPILKLWPAYFEGSSPTLDKSSLTAFTKKSLVNGARPGRWKSGALGGSGNYWKSLFRRQTAQGPPSEASPITTVTPIRKGSVLDKGISSSTH
ncbi:hypothetical protein BDR26DRAFT_986035 [Obelidium mucronatum]|nr:hypothetical protein BDR26DRAFT_986035 [Obelidium mucronatum]